MFYSNNKNNNNNNNNSIIIIIVIIIIITNLTLIRSFSKMGHRVILKIYENVYIYCIFFCFAFFVVILCHFLMCNRIIIENALNFYLFGYYYYYYFTAVARVMFMQLGLSLLWLFKLILTAKRSGWPLSNWKVKITNLRGPGDF